MPTDRSTEDENRNIRWLTDRIGELFDKASRMEDPDHAACAKYADLLARILLPAAGKTDPKDGLEEARRAALAEIQKARGVSDG